MKPKETANAIMDIIGTTDAILREQGSAKAYDAMREKLTALVSILAVAEPSYGHAARVHKLTGSESGRITSDKPNFEYVATKCPDCMTYTPTCLACYELNS